MGLLREEGPHTPLKERVSPLETLDYFPIPKSEGSQLLDRLSTEQNGPHRSPLATFLDLIMSASMGSLSLT